MKRVHPLTDSDVESLEYQYKNAAQHHFRIRCQIILLSHQNLSAPKIANRLEKDVDTIYNWINRYNKSGLSGLHNSKGQGNKATLGNLTKKKIDILEKAVADEPQNLNKVSEKLSKRFNLKINKRMLIRFLKKTKL